jgi:hydrogenase nickel incorporation protein HypB
MGSIKVIEVNAPVQAAALKIADQNRARLRADKTFMVNLMASPGAGKTSVLLRTASMLEGFQTGVMEADIDAEVDAKKMAAAGLKSLQVHTGGECAMTADMTRQALDAFDTADLDFLFLENVGNLVCPAEEDVGASARVAILSVPEGDDKPLKYPLMFQVVDAVLINKTDTREYFPFDDGAAVKRIRRLNPDAPVFFVSAKTGDGFDGWIQWLNAQQENWIK